MVQLLATLLKNKSGVTAVEYALIVALNAIAAITIMTTTGGNMSKTFNTVGTKL
jgi:pilus assembly protein Flp/PilA